MQQLRQTLNTMKSTKSTSWDTISIKTIKKLQKQIEPALLNLINTTILTQTYPDNLKTSKAIPLLKSSKPNDQPSSYQLINILPSISKIIDKVTSLQIINYLQQNELIPHSHHGGRPNRSTITALATMLDKWTEAYEQDKNLAIIVLDQSAAYDVIDHQILLKKMEILGFKENTVNYFKNYLDRRRQSVIVDGFRSDDLYIEKMSVIQGSVQSCLMYLIYVLDLPTIFNQTKLTYEQEVTTKEPTVSTFVDDTVTTVELSKEKNHQEVIDSAMTKLEDYTTSNKLILNKEKTKFLVISKKQSVKVNLVLNADPKIIKPITSFKFLGMVVADNLKWNKFLIEGQSSLLSQLKKRVAALKKVRQFTKDDLFRKLANGIFMSKVLIWSRTLERST